ncbi:MAG TPA: lipase family protein [Burkholderiaceae bacterium]|jgi:hypothetical protein|nr:lipase family protein [Burkholderiaceae bacterium]
MTAIAYDASRLALLQPAVRPTVFIAGDETRLSVDAICAECARLAYLRFESDQPQRQKLQDALARLSANAWQDFCDPKTDTQAYAVVLPQVGPLVVFRGTEPDRVTDLGTDLKATTRAWAKGGRVHNGFAEGFIGIRDAIQPWIDSNGAPAPTFTGHSLGAALATLAASHWACTRLTTIGSPRVGDRYFIGSIKCTVARYVDCCDIVTHLPPETPWYEHAGSMVYIDRRGSLRPGASATDVESDRAAARAEYLLRMAWIDGNVPVRDLADHAPINYVRALFP